MSDPNRNEHRSSEYHSSKIKIPKNALIIALAALAFIGILLLMVHYFDRQDATRLLPQTGVDTNSTGPEKADTKSEIPQSAVNWCALGDSITVGVYSLRNPDGSVSASVENRQKIGWAYLVAKENGWNLTNLAFSGEGYLNPGGGTSEPPGYIQARNTDFTPYDLVTVSLGINDWLTDVPMGTLEDDPKAEVITAFIPAMRATLEAVAESNPACKILVILPLNVKGFSQTFGSRETNWAMGYAKENSGTLKEFTDTMKEICGLYGVEYLDMASASCVNAISLPTLLPDGVHPSAEAHSLLARELAAKIAFK